MAARGVERRGSARVSVASHGISVLTSARVRVLDIGSGGLLMSSSQEVPEGLAMLRLALADGQFSSVVQVRHHTGPADTAPRFGAAFVDMSQQSRQKLERFLARTTG